MPKNARLSSWDLASQRGRVRRCPLCMRHIGKEIQERGKDSSPQGCPDWCQRKTPPQAPSGLTKACCVPWPSSHSPRVWKEALGWWQGCHDSPQLLPAQSLSWHSICLLWGKMRQESWINKDHHSHKLSLGFRGPPKHAPLSAPTAQIALFQV